MDNDKLQSPVALFLQAALSPLSLVTPSGRLDHLYVYFRERKLTLLLLLGINHPYYGYTRSTFASQETMFARITSFPALGECCLGYRRSDGITNASRL